MLTDVKQVRALMGSINYYRIFLPDLSKRLRPSNSLLQKGVKFAFTPAMEKLVREILAELKTPPIWVFPNWDAVADGSRPFHVYCDACIDGFGADLEQEQADGSMNPSRTSAELRSTRKGIGLLLIWRPAASFGLSSASEATFGVPNSAYSPTTRRWKAQAKWGTIMPESSGGSSSSPRSTTYSSTAKEARTATPTSCPAYQNLPRSMTEGGRRVSSPLSMAISTS